MNYEQKCNPGIEIPFGAKDSELKGWEYTIPEGMEAIIKDGKVIVKEKESEDERTRKGLIEALKASKTVGELKFILPEPTREECIAYLEKQKEQKPILEVFGFKVGDAVRLKDGDGRKHIIKSFEEVEGIHGPNFYHVEFEDNSARDGIYPGEEYPNGYYTQMEKFEEEQKPAEWDDYTKTNLDRAIQIIKKAKGNLQGYQTDDGIYECDKAIEALEHFLYRGLEIEKPAEWSEEDEEMLNSCISSIEEAKENRYAYKETDGDTSYDHEIDWLKSLRTSWKPSKEQMYILNWVANILLNHDGIVEEEVSKKLQSLYNDLKNLM